VILLGGAMKPLLLDFGAARRVIGDMTQGLTVILKAGYAPVEQYAEVPGMKQGAWTDVYALAAVVYFAVLGKTPPTSVGRLMADSYVPLSQAAAGRYSPNFLAAIDKALAVAGAVVLALDFRLAPQAAYPASVADVNFGTRWLKAHAKDFGSRPDWVGAVASSSGGQQMLLNALRPRDPRYTAITAPAVAGVDAEISYLVACWPISDPLARYQMAKERGNARLVQAHNDYFGNEEAMTEGNPQLILERGEKVSLPSLLILQGTKDDNVTPDMAQRFAAAYHAAGGKVVLETFEDQPHTFVTREPTSAASLRAIELIQRFVTRRGL
jgi:acetyl esterase/lipase